MEVKQTSRFTFELSQSGSMRVPGKLFLTGDLYSQLEEENQKFSECTSFIPALRQISNVASLPGIVGASLAMPDVHSGYGFAIGGVAAFDPQRGGIVSPGGVGFDINCGVRLLASNILVSDVDNFQISRLADEIYGLVPVGIGAACPSPVTDFQVRAILEQGMKWSTNQSISRPEDAEHCEGGGCLPVRTWEDVSSKARKRGSQQLGTLGSGNHYVEVQKVVEIYDSKAADAMGLHSVGQVCVMIHCGSRGLGHQVATDFIEEMERTPFTGDPLPDRQLTYAPIESDCGKRYLSAMAASANFAFVNRSLLTASIRRAFSRTFPSFEDSDLRVVYDVAHNVAKFEDHVVPEDGHQTKRLLVHRKGSTRAFPPGHPELPPQYATIGQPVLVGGTMGTCSYVLHGTEEAMQSSFGSTCHGAGRARSRNDVKKMLSSEQVLGDLQSKGILLRTPNLGAIAEEAPEAYKDVNQVIEACVGAGLSRRVARLEPICVIKG